MAVRSEDINVFDPFDPNTGDFRVEDSHVQNQLILLVNAPGQYYQYATLGVDIRNNLNSPIRLQLLRAQVISEFTKDGYELTDYEFDPFVDGYEVTIDAQKIR